MALVVGKFTDLLCSLEGHKIYRTHHKKMGGVGIVCHNSEHPSNNVSAPCAIAVGLMRNAGDAPLRTTDFEGGVLVPLIKSPVVAKWQLASMLTGPEGKPTHITLKASVTTDKRQHGMAFVHAIPVGMDSKSYRFIGMIDPKHDGRWAIRDLILNYLVSRYREVPACSGEFHDTLDFSEKDTRRKDPTNLSILLNILFLEFTNENQCVACSMSSAVPMF